MKKILFCAMALCLCACSREVGEDELWREKVELPNGTHCMVYHSYDCPHKKPFFLCKEKKFNFRKKKYSVFDYCVSEDEVRILNLISDKNIYRDLKSAFDYGDYDWYQEREGIYDNTNRDYEVYYSTYTGIDLQELGAPLSGFSLCEQE